MIYNSFKCSIIYKNIESLYRMPKNDITLQINYTSIKKKKES